ncbi:hypothetical protein F383_13906 [Gossypium arboreum]|uniref:Uncharacterized protein n=1 Tax=Gossypium arboreum TaxID=29729 RepID=A0A0B0ND74_GOSAR|nr:hypothetical protein F383_13906 [Gossypium arboreum]
MGHLGARFRCIQWYSKCSTGSPKRSSMGNLDEYVKDEKVSFFVQVGTVMYIELIRIPWDMMNLW